MNCKYLVVHLQLGYSSSGSTVSKDVIRPSVSSPDQKIIRFAKVESLIRPSMSCLTCNQVVCPDWREIPVEEKQGKKVCKATALRSCHCFPCTLLPGLNRAKRLPPEIKKSYSAQLLTAAERCKNTVFTLQFAFINIDHWPSKEKPIIRDRNSSQKEKISLLGNCYRNNREKEAAMKFVVLLCSNEVLP